MELSKAIEILSILESRSINNSVMFKKDALKLGLEALIRERNNRSNPDAYRAGLLPGETPPE